MLPNEHHPTSAGFNFVHAVAQDTSLTLYPKEAVVFFITRWMGMSVRRASSAVAVAFRKELVKIYY